MPDEPMLRAFGFAPAPRRVGAAGRGLRARAFTLRFFPLRRTSMV
ncbi:hypothetical protein [Actinoplanes sp. NPDC020271]